MTFVHALIYQGSLTSGALVMGLLAAAILRERDENARWIAVGLIAPFLSLSAQLNRAILRVATSPTLPTTVLFLVQALSNAVTIVLVPLAVRKLIRRTMTAPTVVLYVVIGTGYLLAPVISAGEIRTSIYVFALLLAAVDLVVHGDEIPWPVRPMAQHCFGVAVMMSLLLLLPIVVVDAFRGAASSQISRSFIAPLGFMAVCLAVLIAVFTAMRRHPPQRRGTRISKAFLDRYRITKKEKEIITLLMEGFTAQSIAEKVHLSRQTVKNYTHRIYRKSDVNSKLGLVKLIADYEKRSG